MPKRVNSWTEWDPLKRVIVGRPEGTQVPAPEPDMKPDGQKFRAITFSPEDVDEDVPPVPGHAASIGISGAASYLLGDVLAHEFGWRLAFASAGVTS